MKRPSAVVEAFCDAFRFAPVVGQHQRGTRLGELLGLVVELHDEQPNLAPTSLATNRPTNRRGIACEFEKVNPRPLKLLAMYSLRLYISRGGR